MIFYENSDLNNFFFSNSKFCGDKVAMLSKFGVTVDKLPPGMTEFPMFPGMYLFTSKCSHFIVLLANFSYIFLFCFRH